MSGTILDYLNHDCWQAVLDYVPMKDIIHSERVSRKWQKVILSYLQHVHIGIMIQERRFVIETLSKVRWLTLQVPNGESFMKWTNKRGLTVVAAHCAGELSYQLFDCPHVQALMITDNSASKYIASSELKELEFSKIDKLTGQCLSSIMSSNLKSLCFQYCEALKFHHFLSNTNRFHELRKFYLITVSSEMYINIHILLSKMPKLDHLHITLHPCMNRGTIKNNKFFEAVCDLGNLRNLVTDLISTDKDLEVVVMRCKKLTSLLLDYCEGVTGRGLAAACRHAGARLTRLGVANSPFITDDDVVACVRACPNLTDLDVRSCSQLTGGLYSRLRAERRTMLATISLRLYVEDHTDENPEEHGGLIVHIMGWVTPDFIDYGNPVYISSGLFPAVTRTTGKLFPACYH